MDFRFPIIHFGLPFKLSPYENKSVVQPLQVGTVEGRSILSVIKNTNQWLLKWFIFCTPMGRLLKLAYRNIQWAILEQLFYVQAHLLLLNDNFMYFFSSLSISLPNGKKKISKCLLGLLFHLMYSHKVIWTQICCRLLYCDWLSL